MTDKQPPKRVFIVPYRDRIQQKFFFCKQMEFILEGRSDYEILFVHQCDARNFNRGAMKNIGFLAIKEKYPDSYKDISFIFNDVDTLPFHKLFDYETTPGMVKHHYGFETALGGIVVIKGSDFDLINGYPNYWGWGMEDACLQKRCFAFGLHHCADKSATETTKRIYYCHLWRISIINLQCICYFKCIDATKTQSVTIIILFYKAILVAIVVVTEREQSLNIFFFLVEFNLVNELEKVDAFIANSFNSLFKKIIVY